MRYHEGVGGTETSSPLQFGSYIHRIFELGHEKKTLAELEKIANEQRKNYQFDSSYEPKINTCLRNFLRLNSSLEKTIGTELDFKVPIIENHPNPEMNALLHVIIDRVVMSKKGEVLLIDYKTGTWEKTKLDLFNDPQLRGYCYAYAKEYKMPLHKITLCHYYPLTDNLVTVKYMPSQINLYLKEVVSDIWEIRRKKKVDLVPTQNKFCSSCGYKNVCPEFFPMKEVLQRIEESKKSTPKILKKQDTLQE